MSYLIYTSPEASTGLIPQPGRAVNTFPSGLVRVDQTYLGLTSNAATHRAILAVGNDMPDGDTSPCIDGLKIFPEVQERRREDGFTEYIVSAYGRTKSSATIEKRVVYYNLGALFAITRNTVTASIISHSFPQFSDLNIPAAYFSPVSGFFFNAQTGEPEEGAFSLVQEYSYGASYNLVFSSGNLMLWFFSPGINAKGENALDLPLILTQRNFGYWTEWIFAYG
jgi:hypothetical protein